MVELSVLSTSGLPDQAVFSVRSGTSRRQQPLPLKAPFALPRPPGPYQIDVFDWNAWSKAAKGLPSPDKEGYMKVKLSSKDGRPMSVTFKVAAHEGPIEEETKPANPAGEDGKTSEQARNVPCALDTVTSPQAQPLRGDALKTHIDGYFSEHQLNEFMKEAFKELLEDLPDDPYTWLAQRLAYAAEEEACGGEPCSPKAKRRTRKGTEEAASPSQSQPPSPLKAAMERPEAQTLGSPMGSGLLARRKGGGDGQTSPVASPVTSPVSVKPAVVEEAAVEDQAKADAFKKLRLLQLRQRALGTLVAGIGDGKLGPAVQAAVSKNSEHTSANLPSAGDEAHGKQAASLARLHREDLRLRAHYTLEKGGLTGKLKEALIKVASS